MNLPANHKAVFDLVVAHLESKPGALALSAKGLTLLAQTLAAAQGEARAEGLMGMLAALDFVGTQNPNQPAATTLLGVFLATVEQTHLDQGTLDALGARFKAVTGQSQELKVLGGARPEGTVPAGPGARFAAMGAPTKKK